MTRIASIIALTAIVLLMVVQGDGGGARVAKRGMNTSGMFFRSTLAWSPKRTPPQLQENRGIVTRIVSFMFIHCFCMIAPCCYYYDYHHYCYHYPCHIKAGAF